MFCMGKTKQIFFRCRAPLIFVGYVLQFSYEVRRTGI